MTRYTRLGKSTHQRIAAESTSWSSLKSTPPKQRKPSRSKGLNQSEAQKNGEMSNRKEGNRSNRKRKNRETEVSANFTELGERSHEGSGDSTQSKKVRGFGKSKLVQIFGQFWVPADDAKRLQSLVKKLKTEGLSRKEILAALQNERRRAEKAAKRIRDKTCYGCRQFGHVLSDCPKTSSKSDSTGQEELIEQEMQSGICFKCGTTEHSSRNCKKKGDKFNFAKCFICSKTGHISRQCPENTRGIYPTGGECNICKELTHLAKDCPSGAGALMTAPSTTAQSADDSSSLPVMSKVSNPFASTEYEPIGETVKEPGVKPKKRRVKF